jgi:hypothetical protein
MFCLKDYIGIKHLSLTSESGVYINILPGISTEMVQNITNEAQKTFLNVWDDVQERAYMRLREDVVNTLLTESKADFRNVIFETKKLLKAERNIVTVPAAPEYRGVYFSLPESRYSQFRSTDLYVYALQAATTTLKIFDLNDGEELFSDEVEIVPGLNVIAINQVFELKYRLLEVFVCIDVSLFDTIETLAEYYYFDGHSDFGNGYNSSRVYSATLQTSDDALYDNLVFSGEGKGVVAGAQISCSIDEFICKNKHNFQQSWLYLLGAELLDQKLNANIGSTKLNFFTVSNREQTTETRDIFQGKYYGNLKRELKGVPIDNEGVCFSCEDNLSVFTGGSMP